MSRATLAVAAVAGLVAGAAATLSVQAPAAPRHPLPTPAPTLSAVGDQPLLTDGSGVLLAWTAGGLPGEFADRVAGLPGVEAVTTVAGGRLDLVASHDGLGKPVEVHTDGWRVPLDALAVDPVSYAEFVPAADRGAIETLEPGTALLGSTSARLRRLQAGDTLTLASGHRLRIAGVVDDAAVAAAEVVVGKSDANALGIGTDRFALLQHRGARSDVASALRGHAPGEIRVRGPGETPWMRHGDAVLPQSLVKARFGEFAYRPAGPGRQIEQDPEWVAEHIVTITVPVLGTVRCHRGIVRQLRAALQELADGGLAHLVDPETFAGCHAARLIRAGAMPSRHAWGIALDLNAEENPTGFASGQDARLVDTFARSGFTWGGFWLVPDPMHLEYVGPRRPEPGKVVAGD